MSIAVVLQSGDERGGAALPEQLTFERIERRDPFVRTGLAFIGEIVGMTCEAIQGMNRRSQARRQQDRGNRKVFVMPERIRLPGEGCRHWRAL